MRRSTITMVIIFLALIVAGGLYAARHSATTVPAIQTTRSQSGTQTTTPDASTTSQAVTVTYSDSGFSPAKVTLKSGGTITFVNSSSHAIQPSSDPHPAHTDEPELNLGIIAAGKSKTIIVTKVGSWGVHNHLNESEGLRVAVQ